MENSGPLTGSTLGNYKLAEILDRGGVGSVYVAEHRFFAERVAIKVLHEQPRNTNAEEIAQRFFQEARATRSIDHPNVVKVLDFGQTEGGMLYLAMELLEGVSIASVLARGSIEERSAAFIASSVASGLHAAHQKGIIHRDLKPGNIFLCANGQVKLLDFGMAKVKEGKVRTGVGMLAGTPQYMSPEQIRQESDIGPSADIYGLGAVLFKMLTGRIPFDSTSLLEIVRMHLNEPAPKPSDHAQVSEQMDAIVLACLDKDAKRRPATMLDLCERLRPIAEKLGPEVAAGLGGGRDRAAPAATPATAKKLQELARTTAEPQERPARGRRRGGSEAVIGVLLVLALVGAVAAVVKPWARSDSKAAPATTEKSPAASTEKTSAPTAKTPAATGKTPTATEKAPAATEKAPAATEKVPAATEKSATPSEKAAVPSEKVATPSGANAEVGDRVVLNVESEPAGAQVFADHVLRGVAPLDVTTPLPVELKLTMNGYKTLRKKITKAGPVHIKLYPDSAAPHLPPPPQVTDGKLPPD